MGRVPQERARRRRGAAFKSWTAASCPQKVRFTPRESALSNMTREAGGAPRAEAQAATAGGSRKPRRHPEGP